MQTILRETTLQAPSKDLNRIVWVAALLSERVPKKIKETLSKDNIYSETTFSSLLQERGRDSRGLTNGEWVLPNRNNEENRADNNSISIEALIEVSNNNNIE